MLKMAIHREQTMGGYGRCYELACEPSAHEMQPSGTLLIVSFDHSICGDQSVGAAFTEKSIKRVT